jgi:hypothetical protein
MNDKPANPEDFLPREVKAAEPQPLTRELPPGEHFPLHALGKLLANAVNAAADRTRAPTALAAQSFISTATLIVLDTFVDDLKIEFRQIQKAHPLDLDERQWLELFEEWLDHYRAKLEAGQRARDAQLIKLWERRSFLLARRAAHPEQHAVVDRALWEVANAIADLYPRPVAKPMGTWESSP